MYSADKDDMSSVVAAQPVKVDITAGRISDPLISDVMTFVTFSALFFLMNVGLLPADAAFTVGVLQLCLVGLFFAGSRERAKYNYFWGNMNFIFVFFFGVLGGIANILMGLGFSLNGVVLAIPNVICGALMLCTIPGVKHDPWTSSVLYVLAGIAVFALGLAGLGFFVKPLQILAGILLGGVALLGFWSMIVAMLGFTGIKVPVGKPFSRNKE